MTEPALDRLTLNRESVRQIALPDLVRLCATRGIGGLGLWRYDVEKHGADDAARLVHDAGMTVTSLCRGGFFTSPDPTERARSLDDNRRAIDETAALGAPLLVLVSGGLPDGDRDLTTARSRVADAVAELAPYAQQRGVRLAVEPLHPMFCSDRCVVNTLDQALAIASAAPVEAVGVVVDTYHCWWEPDLYAAIDRLGERIAVFQASDWVTPLPAGVLTGRGVMGDGCIPLRELRQAVERTGYDGPLEVEIFSDELWGMEGERALDLLVERYRRHV